MNCAKGKSICAVVTVLLFCTLVLGVTEGQNSKPTVSFTTVPETPEAKQPFSVDLTVEIDSSIFPSVFGSFGVNSSDGTPVYGPYSWSIDFDSSTTWKITFTDVVVPSAGPYNLWTEVNWIYKEPPRNLNTIVVKQRIYVASPPGQVESYSIEWLKPISLGKPFQAGSTIKIKFSVLDSNGDFKHDETVKVAVTDSGGNEVFTAVYGEGADPVRIKTVLNATLPIGRQKKTCQANT